MITLFGKRSITPKTRKQRHKKIMCYRSETEIARHMMVNLSEGC